MKKALLSLAVAGIALSFAQAAFANVNGQRLRTVFHPPLCAGREEGFPITEAYRATSSPFPGTDRPTPGQLPSTPASALSCLGVQLNNRWCGEEFAAGPPNTTAAPGALALCTRNVSGTDRRQRLDVNRFVMCPSGFGNAVVQSFRLQKVIPVSRKCPGVYQAATFIQFGANVRTWWTLIYTSPGTMFILELTVVCTRNIFPFDTEIHVDRWKWTVVVTFDSLQAVIDVLHSNSLSTSEIPCIASEDFYNSFKARVDEIRVEYFRTTGDAATRLANAQNALFNAEALLTVFCAFGDCFDGTTGSPGGTFFMTYPPSNDVQMSFGGMLTGVLDTPENPCCCKLLVDLERLGETYGIVSL